MKPYYYIAEVVSVYDGDTITCNVDLGFKTFKRVKVRLTGIDTPEIRTRDLEEKKRGYESRDWLSSQILGKNILLHTQEKGKFGRWLGTIWSLEEENLSEENSYNQKLILEGHANPYNGGKRKWTI